MYVSFWGRGRGSEGYIKDEPPIPAIQVGLMANWKVAVEKKSSFSLLFMIRQGNVMLSPGCHEGIQCVLKCIT